MNKVHRKALLVLILIGMAVVATSLWQKHSAPSSQIISQAKKKIISGSFDTKRFKTDADWKKILTATQYNILRQAGTEIPFTGKLEYENRKGTYLSAGCNEPVFRSEQKYDSGTGWPSFWAPINPGAVVLQEDDSIPGQQRIEVLDKCGGHLGHIFDDGPTKTGLRYCVNSLSLDFKPENDTTGKK